MIIKSLNLRVSPLLTPREYLLVRGLLSHLLNLSIILGALLDLVCSLNSYTIVSKLNSNSSSNFFNKLFGFVLVKDILISITNVFPLDHLTVLSLYKFTAGVLVGALLHLYVWLHFRWTVVLSYISYTLVFHLLCVD